jgi:hypothetical protein
MAQKRSSFSSCTVAVVPLLRGPFCCVSECHRQRRPAAALDNRPSFSAIAKNHAGCGVNIDDGAAPRHRAQ